MVACAGFAYAKAWRTPRDRNALAMESTKTPLSTDAPIAAAQLRTPEVPLPAQEPAPGPSAELQRVQAHLTSSDAHPRQRVKSLYEPPSDPRELAKRFFGDEAREIARRWEGESVSPRAKAVENDILSAYLDAQADESVQAVECRNTLCRIQLDRKLTREDRAAVQRMAGKLGVNGWMLEGNDPEHVFAFVPLDFVPM